MYNSQYYTCEQIDQRLLQGYVDDYNYANGTHLTKDQFLNELHKSFNQPDDPSGVKSGIVYMDGEHGTVSYLDYTWASEIHNLKAGDSLIIFPYDATSLEIGFAEVTEDGDVIEILLTGKNTFMAPRDIMVSVGIQKDRYLGYYNYVIVKHDFRTGVDALINSNSVLFNGKQSIPEVQQAQARQNIGIYGEEFGNDKEYNPAEFSGLGKVYLKKNIVEVEGVEKNILTQRAFYKDGTQTPNTDTIYVVQYDFDLNSQTINVPARCVLMFDGGSINNGTLVGNNTYIDAGLVKILGTDVTISGTWNVAEAYPEWFGALGDDVNNDTLASNKVLNYFRGHKIVYSEGKSYRLDRSVVYSDTVIEINGTLKSRSSSGVYFEFFDRVTETPGYTGVHDVVVHGHGTVDYDYLTHHSTATIFRCCHCKNITIKDIKVINSGRYHVVECGGTDGMLIQNVTMYSSLDSNDNGELIQFESISEAGTNGAIPYDRTSSRNITVENCTFIKDTRTTAKYRFVGGNHCNDELNNISILNCRFIGDGQTGPGNDTKLITINGSAKNYIIKGCVFENFAEGNCIYLCVNRKDSIRPDPEEPYKNEAIIISNNVFKNVRGGIYNEHSCLDITISDNVFTVTTGMNNGSPIGFAGTDETDTAIIANNIFDGTNNGIYVTDWPHSNRYKLNNLIISGNVFRHLWSNAIYLYFYEKAENIVIMNNVFDGFGAKNDNLDCYAVGIYPLTKKEPNDENETPVVPSITNLSIFGNIVYLHRQNECRCFDIVPSNTYIKNYSVSFYNNSIFNTSILSGDNLARLHNALDQFAFVGNTYKSDNEAGVSAALLAKETTMYIEGKSVEHPNTIKFISNGDRTHGDGIGIYNDTVPNTYISIKIISGNGSFSDSEDDVTETELRVAVHDEAYGYKNGIGIRSLDNNPVVCLIESASMIPENITGIYAAFFDIDLSELFEYMPNAKYFKQTMYGDIYKTRLNSLDDIPTSIIEFDVKNTCILNNGGNISTLAKLSNAKVISINNTDNITGDITSLSTNTNLTEVSLAYQRIGGTLEEFAAAQVAAGRTSGDLIFRVYGGNNSVTYKESTANLGYSTVIHFDSSRQDGYYVTDNSGEV